MKRVVTARVYSKNTASIIKLSHLSLRYAYPSLKRSVSIFAMPFKHRQPHPAGITCGKYARNAGVTNSHEITTMENVLLEIDHPMMGQWKSVVET